MHIYRSLCDLFAFFIDKAGIPEALWLNMYEGRLRIFDNMVFKNRVFTSKVYDGYQNEDMPFCLDLNAFISIFYNIKTF